MFLATLKKMISSARRSASRSKAHWAICASGVEMDRPTDCRRLQRRSPTRNQWLKSVTQRDSSSKNDSSSARCLAAIFTRKSSAATRGTKILALPPAPHQQETVLGGRSRKPNSMYQRRARSREASRSMSNFSRPLSLAAFETAPARFTSVRP